jgi:surface polysaccharide O-acyltransferase-like enzyme
VSSEGNGSAIGPSVSGRTQPAAVPAATGGRSTAVDLGKLVAAACVVGLHAFGMTVASGNADPVARWLLDVGLRSAIPFFFIVSGFYHGSNPRRHERDWSTARLSRLLIVYAGWSAFYLALYGNPDPIRLRVLRIVLFGNTFFQLWFMWALIVCTSVVSLLIARGWSRACVILGSACAVVYVAGVALSGGLGALGAFIRSDAGHWWYVSPIYWLAFYSLGVSVGESPDARRWLRLCLRVSTVTAVLFVGLGIAASALGRGLGAPATGALDALAYGATGTAAACAALSWPSRSLHTKVAWWTSLPLGIYVVHPFFLYSVVPAIVHGWRSLGDLGAVAGWAIALALSCVTVVALRQVRPLRVFL